MLENQRKPGLAGEAEQLRTKSADMKNMIALAKGTTVKRNGKKCPTVVEKRVNRLKEKFRAILDAQKQNTEAVEESKNWDTDTAAQHVSAL